MDKYIFLIKEFRDQEGITQEQLAEKTGVCRKTIALMEQPEGYNPRIATVKRIARYFNTSVDRLMGNLAEEENE